VKSVLADRLFHLKENGTTVRRECFAGLTTFVTMAYILAVTASALAACAATLLMALLSNYPFALAPGMGLNAYFAYTVVIKQGYSWQMALAAVFLEGLLFIVLSVTSVREAIFNSIPRPLKLGVTWGIGLFILFIGLQNSKLIVADPSTMLSVYPFREAIASGEIRSVGLGAVLAFAGILLTAILTIRRVKGALLLGILAVWGAAILCQLTGLYVPNAELGMASVLPDFSAGLAVPSLAPTFMQMDFTGLFTLNFLTVVLSFLFVDVFDTLGGIIGMASQGHMLDENGRLPRIRGALLSDAVGTSVGAVLGAVVALRMPPRLVSLKTLLVALMSVGLGSLLYVGTPYVGVALIGQIALGVAWGVVNPLHNTIVQTTAPLEQLGRVNSVMGFGNMFAGVAPLAIAPWLAATFGVQQTLVSAGMVVTAVPAALLLFGRKYFDRAEER